MAGIIIIRHAWRQKFALHIHLVFVFCLVACMSGYKMEDATTACFFFFSILSFFFFCPESTASSDTTLNIWRTRLMDPTHQLKPFFFLFFAFTLLFPFGVKNLFLFPIRRNFAASYLFVYPFKWEIRSPAEVYRP